MKTSKLTGILIALVMLLTAFSADAFASETVNAERLTESATTAETRIANNEANSPVTRKITFTLTGFGNDILNREYSVSSDADDLHGYKTAKKDHNGKAVEGVTLFDALVAVHEDVYGKEFNENPEKYLIIDSGYVLKAFGKASTLAGFAVNGVIPNDGIINPAYGSCTGYTSDTAILSEGDSVTFFMYRDTSFYADYMSVFGEDEYTATAGEAFTVSLTGYSIMYYGFSGLETILESYAEPMCGVEIFTVVDGKHVTLGTTDENGSVAISFAAPGEYTVFSGDANEDGEPVIVSSARVQVGAKPSEDTSESSEKQTFLQRLTAFFAKIIEFFKKIFKV